MALHIFDQLLELRLRPLHPERPQQRHASFHGQARELHLRRSGLPVGSQIRDGIPGGDHAQAVVVGGQPFQQGGQPLVLQLARRGRGGRVLQRLQAIQDQQRPPLAHQLRQPPAFVERPLRTDGHLRVAEEGEGILEKHVGRGRYLLPRPLAVERPRQHRLAPRPLPMRQLRRPLRHQRRLPLAPQRNERDHVRTWRFGAAGFVPCVGEELGFRLAPDQFHRGVFVDARDVDTERTGRRDARTATKLGRLAGDARFGLQCSNKSRLRAGLAQQEIVKYLVGRVRGECVPRQASQRLGNGCVRVRRQEHGDKLPGLTALVVNLLRDERSFPIRAFALLRNFMAAETPVVGLGANHQHERGGIQLVEHPTWPALRRRAIHILVKDRDDPVGAKPFGQTEHPLAVGVRIVAIADEDGDFAHRASPRK